MIRSKINFFCQLLSEWDVVFRSRESKIVATNDIVATVGIISEEGKRYVIRRSLLFGTEWQIEVASEEPPKFKVKCAVRDELQSEWFLNNWAKNRLSFEIAECEEVRLRKKRDMERYADGLLAKKMLY